MRYGLQTDVTRNAENREKRVIGCHQQYSPAKKKETKARTADSRTIRNAYYLSERVISKDIYDIMKVTGHASPEILKKYIKADSLDVAEKLSDKYDYFDWFRVVDFLKYYLFMW